MTFCEQPFGSQETVDFMICPRKGVCWPIELKSTKKEQPKLNSLMKHDVYYVYSSAQQVPATTIFQAGEFISRQDTRRHRDFIKHLKKQVRDFNTKYPHPYFKILIRPSHAVSMDLFSFPRPHESSAWRNLDQSVNHGQS